ncbi:hypothetical protein [Candidatus Nitrospira inopinata]|jgi:hypothetical protein|uniref:Uncharacterized protein n=1 Tax=Candidatus Nitrospira inopinata TaxID=1715989 RepID=A0A0S4KMY5_9BACT|nr:hypothetical protein [Candidatus Nitrospira inopinata]CUQ65285.1 protein of unknown function [Candidatus Nitrospira inopinata]
MDWSSVIDAGLVVTGAIAVLAMGLSTLSVEPDALSVSEPPARIQSHQMDPESLPKAA